MTKLILRIMAVLACAGVVVGATGCKSVCRANKEAGLATIVCQPVNTTVGENDNATFKVKACGQGLEYQWYFNDGTRSMPLEDNKGYRGAQGSELFISNVSADKLGHYSCQIISYDAEENPAITQTRMATLGFTTISKQAHTVNTVDHQPLPPGSSGTSTCGVYRAFVLFDNNHAGYKPTPGQTVGTVKVNFTNSGDLPPGTYNLLWKVRNTLDRGCASDSGMGKTFPCDASKSYNFIVYFKTWPPPAGSGKDVVLDLNF